MNWDTSFSFDGKDTKEHYQNPKKTSVRKTPLKARKTPPEKPFRKPRNDRRETKYTTINLSPNEKAGIKGAQEPLKTESAASWTDLSMETESASNNLSPKEKSGIEDTQEPLHTERYTSCLDLSMKNEDLKTYRDVDENCKPPREVYYDFCSSSSMTIGDQFEETLPDGKSQQTIISSREGSSEHGSMMKIELPREMAIDLALFLDEKVDESLPYMKTNLLEAKKMIEYQLMINDGDGLGIPAKDLRFGKVTSANFVREMISTSLELCDIIVDYQESLSARFGNHDSANLLQKMMDTSLRLSDIVLEYDQSFGSKLGGGEQAKLIRELMDTSQDLREIILEYEESLDPIFDKGSSASLLQMVIDTSRDLSEIVADFVERKRRKEDHRNPGPSFLANALLLATVFAGFMFPALFVRYAPSEWWQK